MYHFLDKISFYKNTYGKSFLVRIEFSVKLPAKCLLVADNYCQCDAWFTNTDNVKIKYDINLKGSFNDSELQIVYKSIIVDLNKPINGDGFAELIISNNGGLCDLVKLNYSDFEEDIMKNTNFLND